MDEPIGRWFISVDPALERDPVGLVIGEFHKELICRERGPRWGMPAGVPELGKRYPPDRLRTLVTIRQIVPAQGMSYKALAQFVANMAHSDRLVGMDQFMRLRGPVVITDANGSGRAFLEDLEAALGRAWIPGEDVIGIHPKPHGPASVGNTRIRKVSVDDLVNQARTASLAGWRRASEVEATRETSAQEIRDVTWEQNPLTGHIRYGVGRAGDGGHYDQMFAAIFGHRTVGRQVPERSPLVGGPVDYNQGVAEVAD